MTWDWPTFQSSDPVEVAKRRQLAKIKAEEDARAAVLDVRHRHTMRLTRLAMWTVILIALMVIAYSLVHFGLPTFESTPGQK